MVGVVEAGVLNGWVVGQVGGNCTTMLNILQLNRGNRARNAR